MVQTHCPMCDWPADVLRGTRVHSGGFCEAFPLPVSVKWLLPHGLLLFSYFPEVHSVLFLESSFPHGLFSLGQVLTRFYQSAPSMVSQSMRDLHIFLYKGDSEVAPLALSFSSGPAIFLSQFSFLSAVVSGQINTSTDLTGQ